jgi:hypothetical protein
MSVFVTDSVFKHSHRGVLPSAVCKCDREASILGKPWPTKGCRATTKKKSLINTQTSILQNYDWNSLSLIIIKANLKLTQ